MGPFLPSFENLYIIVALDYVSKKVEAATLPTNDAKSVVKFLHKTIFSRFGTSRAIISDEGTHFCNRIFAQQWLGTELNTRLPQHITHNPMVKQKYLTERSKGF